MKVDMITMIDRLIDDDDDDDDDGAYHT